MTGSLVWLEFAAALILVSWGGKRLTHYGEGLGQRWGLGTTWVGLVLLATVTSLPELVTGLSAVTLAGATDIAVGTILGSCVFNLAILVLVDFVLGDSVYTRLSRNHLLSAGYGIVLIGIVGFNLLAEVVRAPPVLGPVGIYSPVIFATYLLAVRSLYRHEQVNPDVEHADRTATNHANHAALVLGFLFASICVVAAGIWLPFVGQRIAIQLGVEDTFVGTIFIAFATSMPEITVAVAAVRIGAPNMAVSNLLGSNLFNIAILPLEDLAFTQGPILAHASPTHAISALAAVTMTGVAMVAMVVRPKNRPSPRLGAVGAVLIAIYLINTFVLFLRG